MPSFYTNIANLNIHFDKWHPIGVNYAVGYPKHTRTGSKQTKSISYFLVINAFAIIPKKIFSCTLNTTNGLYILETYNVMQIFVAICKKTLEFNIKMHGMQIFDESRSFKLFQVVTLVLFEVSNLQSY